MSLGSTAVSALSKVSLDFLNRGHPERTRLAPDHCHGIHHGQFRRLDNPPIDAHQIRPYEVSGTDTGQVQKVQEPPR